MPGVNLITGNDSANPLSGTAGKDLIYGFNPDGPQGNVTQITQTRIASGFSSPVYTGAPFGDTERLFVVEKGGLIKIIDLNTNQVNATPFLDVSTQISTLGEKGLLGLAFDPEYATNRYIYVNLINTAGQTEIRRYQAAAGNPDAVDPASGTLIITVPQPADNNHKAGWLGFGPDGYLYIPTGDGGGSGDPNNLAQNMQSLLGKVLRLDVRTDGFPGDPGRNYSIPADNPFIAHPGLDEIWALGLRNPWRSSFDRGLGDLFIGDVGQNTYEEIDLGASGANFGWRIYEGPDIHAPGTPSAGALTAPIHYYGRAIGSVVTGGYVYRGASEGLQGQYFFADVATDDIFTLRNTGGTWAATTRSAQIVSANGLVNGPVSFGEDGRGNLYVVGFTGDVDLLTPVVTSADQGDTINAGAGDDIMFGGSGNDAVSAGEGRDTVYGGNGADAVLTSYGQDIAFGDAGDDTIYGGAENDTITGDAGNDFLYGEHGADVLLGGAGIDVLFIDAADTRTDGGAGIDYIVWQDVSVAANLDITARSADYFFGFSGNDSVTAIGAADRPEMHGAAGNDTLTGSAGVGSILLGEGDNDRLVGNTGIDHFVGGPSADTFVFALNGGTDYVYDFTSGADKVEFSTAAAANYATLTVITAYGTGGWWGYQYATGTVWLNTSANANAQPLIGDFLFV